MGMDLWMDGIPLTDSAKGGWLSFGLVIRALPPLVSPRAVVVGSRRFEIRSGEDHPSVSLAVHRLVHPSPLVGDGDRFWSPGCWLDEGCLLCLIGEMRACSVLGFRGSEGLEVARWSWCWDASVLCAGSVRLSGPAVALLCWSYRVSAPLLALLSIFSLSL